MTTIDPRLGDYAGRTEFALMMGKSPRTISRWIAQPDGLPYLTLGNEVLIPIGGARAWMAAKVKRPNQRRKAA